MARAGRALMLERFQMSATADGIAAVYDRHFASVDGVASSTDSSTDSSAVSGADSAGVSGADSRRR
jgi:hypothetical protein